MDNTNKVLIPHHNKLCEMLGNLYVARSKKQDELNQLDKDIVNVLNEIEAVSKSVQLCAAVEQATKDSEVKSETPDQK